MFDDEQLAVLIKGQPIEQALPFDTADESSVRRFYEPLVRNIELVERLKSRVEWNHYGSGYASFIDAWFYPSDDSSRVSPQEQRYLGIFVLLSRLSRFFVIGQGEKSWSTKGGASYMPDFDLMDAVKHRDLVGHAETITRILVDAGLVRLKKEQLEQPLAQKFGTPSILSSPPHRHFDALFHWND